MEMLTRMKPIAVIDFETTGLSPAQFVAAALLKRIQVNQSIKLDSAERMEIHSGIDEEP
jgi:hypothetical protein